MVTFLYAISFSYAYVNIDAGFGALLLFGVVQLVMVIGSVFYKEKLTFLKMIGIGISIFGLSYLLYPSGEFEVSFFHAFLMIVSGFSWAIYSILGKKSSNALENTTDNFLKASIFIVLFYFIFSINDTYLTTQGLVLSLISGSITSALGYIIWYQILPKVNIITASVVQLIVPIIAILLSILFLDESFSFDLFISTVMVICGICLIIFSKSKK